MNVVLIIFLLAFGACVGSFLNVVIYRMPRGESIVFPGSHCPACGTPINWYDNLPLVSWLVLRGKCRACGVAISPRYLIIEGVTAVMIVGLFVCYYLLHLRAGEGKFVLSWPMFAAHASLLCTLLVCSVVDIQFFSVPLEVCWFASVVGLVSSAASPHPWVPSVSPVTGAVSLAAAAGLVISVLLQRYGLLTPSFIDVADGLLPLEGRKNERSESEGLEETTASPAAIAQVQSAADVAPAAASEMPAARPKRTVGATSDSGVNCRKEILREVLFLAPAVGLAVGVYYLMKYVPAAREWWNHLACRPGNAVSAHLNGFLGALFGYLVGGLWVWGIRIVGTLAFNKEAMGMGDVHILAAVGAVTGWVIPTISFFIAPVLGLVWGVYILLNKKEHELPYGPWLAGATVAAMLLYDRFMGLVHTYMRSTGLG